MTVKVSPKYQVVIPEGIREALGIKPGIRVDVIAKGRVAYLVPLLPISDVRESVRHRLNSAGLREKGNRKL